MPAAATTAPPPPGAAAPAHGWVWRWTRRAMLILLVLVLIAVLGASGALVWSIRRPFPQTTGTLRLPILDAPVDVYRDELGVATIVASTDRDLARAQGFVHAQDRFWQMDVARHIGGGRLAELFGPSQLAADRFLRTVGWERASRAELAILDAEVVQVLDDYAAGVNAYLQRRPHRSLGFEYTVLALDNPDYRPQPWEPAHTLLFLRLMAWELRGNIDRELEQAVLEQEFGLTRTAELFPPYGDDVPRIVPGSAATAGSQHPRTATTPDPAVATALTQVADAIAAVEAVTGRRPDGVGSNSWVVAGSRTATGAPMLADDPHLGVQIPSMWYANALRCRARDERCGLDVTGFSLAGAPGIIMGHNDRIAWGITNLGTDVMDVYVERINPANARQYEVDGAWQDAEVRIETLRAADGTTEQLEVRVTRNGPIISGLYDAAGEVQRSIDTELSLRWLALEPNQTVRAILRLNRASTWAEFRDALRDFAVPAQSFVYADVDGNIGYQAPGLVPIRPAGVDGNRPVPGWDSSNSWTGFVPFDELPMRLNPSQGYIVAANNPVEPPGYPYHLSADYDYGQRAARIEQLITGAPRPLTLDDLQAMQGDNRDPGVDTLVPALLAVDPAGDGRVAAAQALLAGWDGQMDRDSAAAAMYAGAFRHTLLRTFSELPTRYRPNGRSRWVVVLGNLLAAPANAWWDDPATAQVESRDAVLHAALADAVDELTQRLGDDPDRWRWGALHTATFRHQTLGASGIRLVEARFNRGPVEAGGGFSIVNATGWDPQVGYEVVWHPSARLLVDLSDFDELRAIHPPGNSGHAYHPHYADTMQRWADNSQHRRRWSLERITARGQDHLVLEP